LKKLTFFLKTNNFKFDKLKDDYQNYYYVGLLLLFGVHHTVLCLPKKVYKIYLKTKNETETAVSD